MLLRLDRRGRLRFASLQGPSGQAFLRAHGLPERDFSTLVFIPDWGRRDGPGFLMRAAGVAAALQACGGAGRLLGAAIGIFPAAWGDAAYGRVARIRQKLFGPWRACPLPKPEWARRFID
jgi:predicted DCC family thiol-disulfide oxidoreductase YuxK